MSQEYVDREVPNISRVCQMVESAVGIVLVEAPKGYGKSLLARCLADGPNGFTCISGSGLADYSESVSAGDVPLVIDGVTETLSPGLLDTLNPDDRNIVITGRDLSHLERWGAGRDILRIGVKELSLSREDIHLLASPVLGANEAVVFSDAAFSLTRGWPALICALLADSTQSESIRSGVLGEHWNHGFHVSSLVQDCLDDLDEVTLDAFGQLAHLPSFSASCVTAIAGPGGLAMARANGLPILQRSDGWLSVARPVNEHLRSTSPFRTLSAELLGPILVAAGGLVYAARSLLAAGNASVAADLLCSVPGYRFDDHNQAELAGMIRSLDSRLEPESELMLLLARVHHNRAEIDQQRVALHEAERRATALDDHRSQLEAQTELLFLDLGQGQAGLLPRLRLLEDQVNASTMPTTMVRLREVRAMYLAQSQDLSDVYASITLFKDVSYEWESLGEPDRAAWTIRLFAGVTCWHLGRYRDASDALDRAIGMVEGKPASLVKILDLAARMAARSADRQRFDLLAGRARALLPGLALDWVDGFLSWSEMTLAALEVDEAGVGLARTRAASLLGVLLDHPTGAVFLADSACAFAQVGAGSEALAVLGEATKRRTEAQLEVALAEITVHARVGDAGRVPYLVESLNDSGGLPFERHWRVELEALIAENRSSMTAPDEASLLHLKNMAVGFGLETLWNRMARNAGFTETVEVAPTELILLGSFSAVSNSVVSDSAEKGKRLAPGHSTQLIKYLAAAGGDVPIEVVIDVLWPEGDPERGRKRLRNVINRTRAALGAESVLRTGDLIRLGDEIRTDLAQFRALGSQALTGPGSSSERSFQAIEALNLYGGDLLPEDVYSEWVDGHRQTARLTAIGLLDLVLAQPPSDVVPSWLLETAGRVGVKTEESWVEVARFSYRRGAMECCRVAALQAETVAHELGYEPSAATKKLLEHYR